MLDTESGYVESVFHEFVRPVHFAKLSDYCVTVTGITQSFIDRQKPFKSVYDEFVQWLQQNIIKYSLIFATPQTTHSQNGANVTFCTWSDWDLGHYFYRDCFRNDIKRFECMKSWIDIRRAFEVSKMILCSVVECRYDFFFFFFEFSSICFVKLNTNIEHFCCIVCLLLLILHWNVSTA